MLDAKVKELINTQINQEFYSEYLYLAFANYFYDNGLDGFANWYDVQAQEERDHAMLMRTYLHNNGERVTFSAIAEPQNDFDSIKAVLKAGLAHEQYVTSLINKIYQAADKVHDYRTMQCFDWFVKEQDFTHGCHCGFRRRKECRRFDQEIQDVRQRCQRPLCPESGITGPYVCRPDVSPVRIHTIP